MKCPQCDLENRPHAKFCRNCGSKLAQLCLRCRHDNPPDSRFCEACGAALEVVPTPKEAGTVLTALHVEIPEDGISLEEIVKEYIRVALIKTNGNQTKAAELLRISRRQLQNRMQSYGFSSQGFKRN